MGKILFFMGLVPIVFLSAFIYLWTQHLRICKQVLYLGMDRTSTHRKISANCCQIIDDTREREREENIFKNKHFRIFSLSLSEVKTSISLSLSLSLSPRRRQFFHSFEKCQTLVTQNILLQRTSMDRWRGKNF